MTSRIEAARAALRRVPALHEAFHEPIVAELDHSGLLDRPKSNGGTVSAASTSERLQRLHAAANDAGGGRATELRNATLELRRLGVPFDEENGVNVEKLAAATARWSPTERIRIKSQLYRVGLLD
jgi:hypothetical protein